jgi:CDP-diacylglycerol--glycerol-3-phosphate 3-phosphatidyltransferase
MIINVPNQITLIRLLLALVFFLLLSLFDAARPAHWLLQASFWVFVIAAVSDILDGFIARLLKQVTPFGRIVDPVVDKVIICGAFVLLAGPQFSHEGKTITGVYPWMAIVILVREFLVSAIRAHAEQQGEDFSANWVGKLKMFTQSATICIILGQLGWQLDDLDPLRIGAIWLTLLITAASIVAYVRRAHRFLLSSSALGGAAEPEQHDPPAAAPAAGEPVNQRTQSADDVTAPGDQQS